MRRFHTFDIIQRPGKFGNPLDFESRLEYNPVQPHGRKRGVRRFPVPEMVQAFGWIDPGEEAGGRFFQDGNNARAEGEGRPVRRGWE